MARRWRRGIGAQAEGMGRGEWSEWRVTKPRDERGARTHRLAKRPNNALRYSETASANTDLPRHGQPSGGPAHPRDPRATRMHAVLPRPLLSTRVLVLLPPNLPNLA